MRDILERLLAGEFTVDAALRHLGADRVGIVEDLARLDADRAARKGVPEIIYAPGKAPEVAARLAVEMVSLSNVALLSRMTPGHDLELRRVAVEAGLVVEDFGMARRVTRGSSWKPPTGGGVVGLLAAGTSDIAVAEEARMVADSMGARVVHAYDVGIAAMQRLRAPLAEMLDAGADVFVVVAGMEGALPTVVSSLVSAPVIGVPASTGYGAGGGGLAPLLSMLQACSPGVVVVNIDNGVGAGSAAALIANRAAAGRA